jgi:hypothetical protein
MTGVFLLAKLLCNRRRVTLSVTAMQKPLFLPLVVPHPPNCVAQRPQSLHVEMGRTNDWCTKLSKNCGNFWLSFVRHMNREWIILPRIGSFLYNSPANITGNWTRIEVRITGILNRAFLFLWSPRIHSLVWIPRGISLGTGNFLWCLGYFVFVRGFYLFFLIQRTLVYPKTLSN